MKIVFFVFSVLALLVSCTWAQITFGDCAVFPPQFTVNTGGFSVAPYPICRNKNMCVTATGSLSTPIVSGAKFSITGTYLGRLVYSDEQNLCSILADYGIWCPVATYRSSLTICVLVKSSVPLNVYMAMKFLATNGDGNIIFCQTSKH
ncbi:hypothetical protein BGZ95_001365 [Linnemannia exigua]|uniref:Phosphatidylglycerol/phosphatidylinositol transfer protein n=1 Tax=Linnemannia exigua TaxID=604196 RepID=A0AAD4DL50_9FUNG|nr:hypothetical protein BGZ95_001365 [Linnemannia exigua]